MARAGRLQGLVRIRTTVYAPWMRALIIEHDHVSPPGPVADRLRERGYDVHEHVVVTEEHFASPGVEAHFPDVTAYDVVVVMGAPWSTYDEQRVGSWVLPELDLLRAADRAAVPVLGICFGGQLLASAHGGSVTLTEQPEVGWIEVTGDEALAVDGRWFAWHFDAWTLPPDAREVARNDAASQAFVLRRNLAVQFHPETTRETLVGWFENGGRAEAVAAGLDAEAALVSLEAWDATGRARAHRLVDAFLDDIAGA